MKKLLALLLMFTLMYSLCACDVQETPGSTATDTTPNSQPTDHTDPDSTVATGENDPFVSDDWTEFTFKLDGIIYELPCDFSQFTDNGWVLDSDHSGEYMVPEYTSLTVFLDQGEQKILVHLVNPGDTAQSPAQCMVDGLWIYEDYGNPTLELANGITMASDPDQVQAAYGTPFYISYYGEGDDGGTPTGINQMRFQTDDGFDHSVAFTFYMDGTVMEIGIRNYIVLEGPDNGDITPPDDISCRHEYSRLEQAASCTAEGSFTYTCNKCGDAYTETVGAKGHVFADTTCEKPKTCHVCNATDGEALGHSYADGKCIRCGAADPSTPTEVTYTVTVRTDKGTLVEGVTVSIYTTDSTPAAVGKTNSKGVATMTLMSAASYKIILSDVPAGFSAKESYTFRSTKANINLTSVPYTTPTDHSKGNYKVGSIMGDFTLTDTDGNSYTLSELLKEKELVILNFWYVSCVPCKAEFPHFEAVYKNYAEDVQLLTMSHFDTEDQIKALRQQMGVTFPMIAENIGFQQGFGLEMYPTTVFIGSSGKILRIKVGDFKSEQDFIDAIEMFLK